MEFKAFEAIKIGLASPEKIREWSYGEVKKPETINYRTLKPERDGLFCERIFGPSKDWECHCGKYKRIRDKGKICEKCGVEVTKSKVRRERMGHIELAAPVSHIWYFKGIPSRMGLILDVSPRVLEQVLYFMRYIVVDPGETPLSKYQILNEEEYRKMREYYEDDFRAAMGAEAIKELLEEVDLEKLSKELKEELENASGQKKSRLVKRLEVVEAFRLSGNRPEWMIMDCIPVIPPEIRPMVQLDGGRFASSDLNDLYRRVINRNNRLKKLLELEAPDIIVRNEKRMLQEAVDALIDNGRRGRPVTGPNNRPLKSLSDMLKGKQGRFRQNLLGKRVDYSGRSVIVVGPDLKIYQCGLPKEMAIELFKPFVMKRLVDKEIATNIKSAKRKVERADIKEVWDALEEVIKEHPVLLNRAPTLHRLGIQAFEPVLVEGRALKLHPLVCTAYNADFDGDQMAVHVPLSAEAQAEARILMLSANNLLKPQDGKPVTVPSQDMVLGCYYLTLCKPGEKGSGNIYKDEDEALMAYQNGDVHIHAPIKVRVTREYKGESYTRIIDATIGRIIFNQNIPQDLGFVDREANNFERVCDLEIPGNVFKGVNEKDDVAKKKQLGQIIDRCIKIHGSAITAEVLDKMKSMGYKYSTVGATTISVFDIEIPKAKYDLISEAEKNVEKITKQFKRGLLTEEERYNNVTKTWRKTTDEVTKVLKDNLGQFNPIYMMADSGARGSMDQIRQLAGMRGLMADTTGRAIEIPIRSNFREGLNVMEYFISSRGARKGLADTALRTADSGYLTRRLVDVSQDVIIREDDCGATTGLEVMDIKDGNQVIEPLADRLVGRYLVRAVLDQKTGEVICDTDTMITDKIAKAIVNSGVEKVEIRSIIGCQCHQGVCTKCYGANLANGEPVNKGEAVGIIAAQSIGEPGTQLTMRTFHTGGIAGDDITQGLPRVEELFEARKPKIYAILVKEGGVVRIEKQKNTSKVFIKQEDGIEEEYQIPFGFTIKSETIFDGAVVQKGDELTVGSANPHDILSILGVNAVENYLIREVQRVYRMQGVDINDKHIEVIVRQMMRKVKVENPGSTNLLPGSTTDKFSLLNTNKKIRARAEAGEIDLQEATFENILLGITKASLATDSFLSAASFQETTRVLTEAAIKGLVDPLIGLKENVIIGKLIPAGTGMDCYSNLDIESEELLLDSEEVVSESEETVVAEETEVAEEVTVEEAKESSEE